MNALAPGQSMQEILEKFPGARRALFRNYHIGGCSSCGFSPDETLEAVCRRNENLDVREVIQKILQSHEAEQKLYIQAPQLRDQMNGPQPPVVVDIRSREEHEAVCIPGSVFMTQDWMREQMALPDRGRKLVFYDHMGRNVLDAASYFIGHGFSDVHCLEGGIEAWALQIDPKMPRYRLEK